MIGKSCFFIGHRDAQCGLLPALQQAVNTHVLEYGVTEFVVGNYGAFDRMAARAVIVAKRQQPGITLLLLLPYHPAERPVEIHLVLMVSIIHRAWSGYLGALQSLEQIDMCWNIRIV